MDAVYVAESVGCSVFCSLVDVGDSVHGFGVDVFDDCTGCECVELDHFSGKSHHGFHLWCP